MIPVVHTICHLCARPLDLRTAGGERCSVCEDWLVMICGDCGGRREAKARTTTHEAYCSIQQRLEQGRERAA